MKDLPSSSEVYRILIQEQVHQEISKTTMDESQEFNMACKVEKRKYNEYRGNDYKNKNYKGNKRQNNNLFCEHCKIGGHTYEKCWKVHGYPPNFKQNSWRKEESKVNTAQCNSSTDAIIK